MLYNDVNPALQVTLTTEEARLLSSHPKTLQKFGMNLTLLPSADDDFASYVAGSVNRSPTCFLQREASELKNNRPSPLAQLLTLTLKEIADTLRETKGAANFLLPKTVSDVLNSQACRGAVKFGDGLSAAVCKRLLAQLSKCNAPFQCAHGRPSVAPVARLGEVLKVTTPRVGNNNEVNLANLHSLMAAEEDE